MPDGAIVEEPTTMPNDCYQPKRRRNGVRGIVATTRSWAERQPLARRQFLKFAVVGGSSTILDLGTNTLIWNLARFIPLAMAHWGLAALHVIPGAHLGLNGMAVSMNTVISSGIVGTANAFYWNQRWTFRATGSGDAIGQAWRFVVVAYTGMLIRAAIVYGFVPSQAGSHGVTGLQNFIYNCIAVTIVMFWNFFLNRAWTFKRAAEDAG